MPIRMTTGSNTPRPAARTGNRNSEILAANPNLDPRVKQALQRGADRISPSVIAVVVAIIALALGVVGWLFQK